MYRGEWKATQNKTANVQVTEEKQQKYESIMCSLYKYQSFCVHFPSIGADRKLLQYENQYSVLLTTSLSLESKISDHKNSVVSHYTGVIFLNTCIQQSCQLLTPLTWIIYFIILLSKALKFVEFSAWAARTKHSSYDLRAFRENYIKFPINYGFIYDYFIESETP